MTARRAWAIHAVLYVALFGGLAFGLIRVFGLVDDIRRGERERAADMRERIDQTCMVQEREHRRELGQLRDTYRYLVALSPAERKATINRFVFASLPALEVEARLDDAPAYCDAPGAGLPEPDPPIPKRPAALRR